MGRETEIMGAQTPGMMPRINHSSYEWLAIPHPSSPSFVLNPSFPSPFLFFFFSFSLNIQHMQWLEKWLAASPALRGHKDMLSTSPSCSGGRRSSGSIYNLSSSAVACTIPMVQLCHKREYFPSLSNNIHWKQLKYLQVSLLRLHL